MGVEAAELAVAQGLRARPGGMTVVLILPRRRIDQPQINWFLQRKVMLRRATWAESGQKDRKESPAGEIGESAVFGVVDGMRLWRSVHLVDARFLARCVLAAVLVAAAG